MYWAAPGHVWLLLLAIPTGILLRRARMHRQRDMIGLAGGLGARLPASARIREYLGFILPVAAFVFLVAALCRPQWGLEMTRQPGGGLEILIALDVSRSMLADDTQPTRLAAAKAAVRGLLPRLRGDRIGLIAFAGSAFTICPPTTDYATFAEVLDLTGPDTLPMGGTALSAALSEARRVLAGLGGNGKVLVLLSDGEDHGGDVSAALESLRGAGVTIHTVSVGTAAGGLIPLASGEFVKNRAGDIVKSRSRTEPLRAMAGTTGGRFIDLATDARALERLYDTALLNLERRERPDARPRLKERFQIPLALALLLLLLLLEPFIVVRGKT